MTSLLFCAALICGGQSPATQSDQSMLKLGLEPIQKLKEDFNKNSDKVRLMFIFAPS